MKKIKTLASVPGGYLSEDKLYGVEIEVEGEHLPTDLPTKWWRIETDSSLKTEEAYEYVTNGPDTLDGVKKRIDMLRAAYERNNTEVYDSVRAGVHVHMNVQDWDVKQLMTFSVCYYIVEDVLLRFCGENREGNLFTLRARDAEYVLFKLIECLNTRNLAVLKNEIIRYASLNYCSLFKYGTVEFRGMRGTGDLDAIIEWVEVIDELRKSSLDFSTPVEVMEYMSGGGERLFLQKLFPTKYHLFDSDDLDSRIRNSARRIQMLAYGTDWEALSKPNVNIFLQDQGL